jgi:hypothetical protein
VAFFLLFSKVKNTITTIVAIIMALSFTMQSCSKDDPTTTPTTPANNDTTEKDTINNDPTKNYTINNDTINNDTSKKPKPILSWKTNAPLKYQDGTENAGNTISFGILATASPNLNITKVTIYLSVNNAPNTILFDSLMKVGSFNNNWVDLTLGNLTGSKNKFTAIVTQSNGQSDSISFTLTAAALPRHTQLTQSIILGSQTSNTGAFFNPKMGANGVMTMLPAISNQSSIHIICGIGLYDKATFSAPSDIDITQIYNSIKNWKTRNASLFRRTTLTVADFDALDPNDASKIDTECTNGTFETKVTQLKVDDVIAYRTFDGSHYALLKVVAIKKGTSSSSEITFDMANPVF